jgi:type VI secretion system protein ImpE
MTLAKDLFDSGELDAAIDQLTQEVRAHPTDTTQRTFLFELLCFAGNWDRAERQLDVLGGQSAEAEVGVQVYKNNIKGERERRRLFSEGIQPHFFAEPPAYVDLLVAAINHIREGKLAEARQMLDRAEEERPALLGRFNGKPFQDFRDSDDRVGPVLELTVRDKYTWLPFEQIKRLEITAPKRLRDLLWAPAIVETTDRTMGEVYVPALYESTSAHPNNQLKLGRMTDWRQLSQDLHLTVGLRLFLVDGEDTPLFEARSVEFDHPATPPGAAEG